MKFIAGYFKVLLLGMLELIHRFPLSIRYHFTDALAITACFVLVKKRNIVKRNLSVIRGSDAPEKDVRAVFKSYGRYWAELPDVESLWSKQLKVICGPDFPPQEKCFLGVTFHIGNFELFGPALFEFSGIDLPVVAERLYPPALFEYFFRIRKKHHIHTIAHDDARKIVSVLKEGKPLGVLCDRSIDMKGTSVNLFGTNWIMPMSAVKYALSLKIPIYYAYCIQDDTMIQLFCKKINTQQSFEHVADEIAHILEDALSNYPLLWHNISQELK